MLKYLYNLDINYPRTIAKTLYNERALRHLILSNLIRVFYYQPLFRLKCKEVGQKAVIMGGLPYFSGLMDIYIGDNFKMQGLSNLEARTDVTSWVPQLIIGNDVSLGHRNVISVGKKIKIGDRVLTAPEVRIRDNDGHTLDPQKRHENHPLDENDILPVTIEDDVWIGAYCLINKGVTIGEGAVIGAGSIVTKDIPPFCVAAGNPAKVIKEIPRTNDV